MTEAHFHTSQLDDIRMRLASMGSGPLVLFCPGGPESWYSWRRQMAAVAAAGYRAVAVLMVNTARYCGFTGRYEGLEKLYAQCRSKGLVVLGFPSNDFSRQVPGSSAQIADFRITQKSEIWATDGVPKN